MLWNTTGKKTYWTQIVAFSAIGGSSFSSSPALSTEVYRESNDPSTIGGSTVFQYTLVYNHILKNELTLMPKK